MSFPIMNNREKRTGRAICTTPAVLSPTPAIPAVLTLVIGLALCSCAPSLKLSALRDGAPGATLSMPSGMPAPSMEKDFRASGRDTLTVVDPEGRRLLLMKAVRDEESGEMVASEQLQAARVTARFRNVAERHGRVDLAFDLTVPSTMRDSRWQLRLHPDMFILGDTLRLDDVIITGSQYRKSQLRGYQQYERFLSRIVTDTSRLVDLRNLELFLERNIPQLYAFRSDSSFVSDSQFLSVFGVCEQQAVDHYTRHLAVLMNENRKARREEMWHRFVKAPVVTEGIRLDTVMVDGDGDFVYCYVQSINTRPGLRKVDVSLSGEIFEQDRPLFRCGPSEPLTFYVSSLSGFADGTERYLTRVIERRVEASASCRIDFAQGSSEIDEELGRNRSEIAAIKRCLTDILEGGKYELDSITIRAGASPEGDVSLNERLCGSRARGVSDYFSRFVRHAADSIAIAGGVFMDEKGNLCTMRPAAIGFRSFPLGENWALLDSLVRNSSLVPETDKLAYEAIAREGLHPDLREKAIGNLSCAQVLRDEMFPLLRTVDFDFHLHRAGMVKDTVHTTVLDTTYMRGVRALKDHDYRTAVALLAPYGDFNSAVALLAADRNLSAMRILEKCPESAQVAYMKALAYSREGDEKGAVQSYLDSCGMDPAFIHRGNLDPEIASLIRKYNLDMTHML